MFEILLQKSAKGTGLLYGTVDAGYFGLVPSAELITGGALATAIGLTAGTAQNNTEGWLKFSYNKKILYIAKKSFRNNLTWNDIYKTGAVYGNDGIGRNPAGVTAKIQDARVVIGGSTYRVRLMRASTVDVTPTTPNQSGEVDNLIRRLFKGTPNGSWPTFTNIELGGLGTGVGSFSWVQETYATDTANRLQFFDMTPSGSFSQAQSASLDSYYSWRPVLELIP